MTATTTPNHPRIRTHRPDPVPTRAAELRPGHAVRIAGIGTIPVAAPPAPLADGQVVIRLGWERLALIIHPATPLDAYTPDRPATFRLWHCPRCGGSGLWLPEGKGKASNGGR
ncbi:hypothetical protein DP939_23285 [Spongiactinospora rosea]|uniref:Uncharacterized protein n=1 Tax=Spongiactinospora rosea TaxID=2248750 RepID=A0A366LVJ7_9ACTN|nr:hypothetical protein [Spongiactinospora rosea]RBQ17787.1 hypothetical protein DP939_23285 [Spongiactinospora rosea]